MRFGFGIAASLLMGIWTGCFSQSPAVKSLPLRSDTAQFQLVLEEISEFPKTYRVGLNDSETPVYFATAARECRTKSRKLSSVARQLFVGFDSLEIHSRHPAKIAELEGVLTQASASVEGQEVQVAAFSSQPGRCVVDYVLWSVGQELSGPGTETVLAEFIRAVRLQ